MTPSFRCIGGSLLYRTIPLTMDDMIAFRDLYREECDAAFKAMTRGYSEDYERACGLLSQVVRAIEEAKNWSRAASVVLPDLRSADVQECSPRPQHSNERGAS